MDEAASLGKGASNRFRKNDQRDRKSMQRYRVSMQSKEGISKRRELLVVSDASDKE